MSCKKVKIKEGDIFIISDVIIGEQVCTLNKKVRLGKLIFISKITKQMIGILVSSNTFEKIPSEMSNISFDNKIYYTGNQLLRNGEWRIVGNQDVTEQEKDLTIRLTGSTLRRLDDDLGVVLHQDRKKYNNQSIKGFGLFYKVLNEM